MDTSMGSAKTEITRLLLSFRGDKHEFPLSRGETSVGSLKSFLAKSVGKSLCMSASDVKILHKGKALLEDDADLYGVLVPMGKKPPKSVRVMATGVSVSEAEAENRAFEEGVRTAPRIRDDLTDSGRSELVRRREVGRKALAKAAARSRASNGAPDHGFERIETLPNLPDEARAREILTSLANDPGVLACMAKHRWSVGCLAEMYPEGKVGESEVCVMGLNQNKGQKILLRLRTDDLKGFRKILSVRKVLFHELAHNVHSEHDGDFFLLMRQIEKECNEMNWTQGSGQISGGAASYGGEGDISGKSEQFQGGTFRLGGNSGETFQRLPQRELAARAAMQRLTEEEEEIQRCCGCGQSNSAGDKQPDD